MAMKYVWLFKCYWCSKGRKHKERYVQLGGGSLGWRTRSEEEGHERVIWVWSLPYEIHTSCYGLSLQLFIKQLMKDVAYLHVHAFRWAHGCYFAYISEHYLVFKAAELWVPFQMLVEQFMRNNRKWYSVIMSQLSIGWFFLGNKIYHFDTPTPKKHIAKNNLLFKTIQTAVRCLLWHINQSVIAFHSLFWLINLAS